MNREEGGCGQGILRINRALLLRQVERISFSEASEVRLRREERLGLAVSAVEKSLRKFLFKSKGVDNRRGEGRKLWTKDGQENN